MNEPLAVREAPASYVLEAQRVKSGYKQTEVGVIPEDWDVLSLFEIAGESKARFDDGDWIEAKYLTASGVRLVQTGNIGEGCFIEKELKKYISEASFTNLGCKEIVAGDVLICRLAAPAGRACVFPDIGEEKVITSVDVTILRPVQDIADEKYLCHVFTKQSWLALVGLRCGGTTHSRISRSELGKLTIALPKLKEQRAIAEALSDADALIEALSLLIAKKRDLKQGAMQQLLTGKKRLPGFSGEWEVKRLGNVVEITKGQLITEKNAVPGNIPVIAGGKKPAYFHNRANRIGKVITVSASGASAGYVAFFDEPIFASDCSTISEGKSYSVEFIYYQLLLNQEEIYKAQTGGAQPHIHAVDLTPFEIGYPDKEEQTAIATILSDMDTEIAALETRLAKTRELKQGMMQELLTGRIRLV